MWYLKDLKNEVTLKAIMRRVVLIGGVPIAGKSYFTRKLSESLQLPWISTDTIRGVMREIVKKEDFPNLFNLDRNDAEIEKYLSSNGLDQVLLDHNAESVDVWKGVKAFLNTDHVWSDFAVEGVAILPKLVSELEKDKYKIKPIFLINSDKDHVKSLVYNKGLWNGSTAFSDKIKEIEIEWVLMFNKYIEDEAAKYGYTTYNLGNNGENIQKLVDNVKDWLGPENI